MEAIRTRFAPSPTGPLHIGGIRTALYSYALAKHSNGDFLLRIEDTDKKREVPGAREKIQELLQQFGLIWDSDVTIQSKRVEQGVYRKVAEKLVADGRAFYCDCKARNAKEEGYSKELRDSCRDKGKKEGAVKLKVPDGEKITFKDFVLDKEISWDTDSLADTTLLKSDGFPTYHLAVVVDDNDMAISHALRGHDWMPSTPIHLLVYKYLGYKLPKIGHLTDILDPEGGKLSKRKGSTSIEGLVNEGYLPEAILNFVMLLGWAPKDNRELFTLEEFVKAFEPKGLQQSNPVFNRDKLDWFNGQYIRQLSLDELSSKFKIQSSKFAELEKEKQLAIASLIRERINKLSEFDELAGFFFEERKADSKFFGPRVKEHLSSATERLEKMDKWEKQEIDSKLLGVVKEKGYKTGDFFMDLRVAITGSKFTPPINDSIAILGKEKTLARLRSAISNCLITNNQ